MWLTRRTCSFQLPRSWTLDDLHPDALALAIAFLVFPFARTRPRVPRPVSLDFARVRDTEAARRARGSDRP